MRLLRRRPVAFDVVDRRLQPAARAAQQIRETLLHRRVEAARCRVRVRDDERLEDAHVFNCRCGILSATTQKLDEIVSQGLQQRMILIPASVA